MQPIELSHISKSFGNVHAVRDFSETFLPGTVHALVGENGAGKSTVGKILAGLFRPESGRILVDGREINFRDPSEAYRAGISIVHQELLFCENLSVAENIGLRNLPSRGGNLDRSAMYALAEKRLVAMGLTDIDPHAMVESLSIGQKQMVQIAASVGDGLRAIVFDEPTSSLSQFEADRLLQQIKLLRSDGLTCIYVSHRLEEIFQLADRITVLRDGEKVASGTVSDFTTDSLVLAMVGRPSLATQMVSSGVGAIRLKVNQLSCPGRFQDVSMEARAGEIVGIAGLVGAGRTELAEALFGLTPASAGEIVLDGEAIHPTEPSQAMAAGIGFVPEDRKRSGLFFNLSCQENLALICAPNPSDQRSTAADLIQKFGIKLDHPDELVGNLSGGNQQKIVLARWIAAQPKVLIVDEPTRGVDVGAKAEIYAILRELANEGTAIIMISSDLPEILAVSDRIVIMRQGTIVGNVPRENASGASILSSMVCGNT